MENSKPLYEVREIRDFRDMLNQSAEQFANEPAFRIRKSNGEYYDINYTEFHSQVWALGTALISLGMKNKKKIAVMGVNSYRWVLTYFASQIAGNVIVPIDKELMFDDINTILEVSETEMIFIDKKGLKKLEERKKELPKKMKIVLMDESDDRDGYIGFDAIFEIGKKLVAENSKYYNEFLNVEINPDDCSVIIFTSGTSGLAKGVMLSQHNICFVVMSNSSVADIHPGDVHLSILPIYHTFECSLDIVAPLYNGCCIAFNDSLLHLMRNFQEVKPTVLMTVPLMLEKFHGKIMQAVSEQKGGKLKLTFGKILAASTNAVGVNMNDKIFEEITKNFGGRLRLIIIGAAAVRPDVIKDFKTFGIPSYIGYGLTECAPLVSCNYDALFTTDTVGRPIPGIEVKLINEDAQGVGEICVKGPNVMLGYYKDEEQTREVLDEYGWFHTGDLGFVGEDGLLRINGRIKNVIVTKNGKNIYPEEIEYHLNNNPLIAESMVVGFDEDDNDETVVEAKIFPDIDAIKKKKKSEEDPSSDEIHKIISDVIKDINKKLPNYKNIKKFSLRESEFIKTTTSKIKRYANMEDEKTKDKHGEEHKEESEKKDD
ncbi:MAG: AMP-binding protein [Clostridia bacterium]|nr:AMP-binding protein [Clostridia bacterium]